MVFDYFRRPVCFGCNSPATSRNVDWRCEDCGYENSLDSLGYPHDVCHPNARQERYCYTTTYSFNDILCQTCIDNQTLILHIVQEAGEGFAGRESLERRYPPLCPECEKLVTKHLSELSSKYRPALELFNQRAMELAQVTAHAAWNHLNVLKCFVMLDGLVCGAHLCLRLYTTQALDIRLQLLRMPELSTLHFWFIYTTRMLEIKTINIYRTLLGVLNLLMLSGLARYSYQTPQYKVHKNPPSLFIYQAEPFVTFIFIFVLMLDIDILGHLSATGNIVVCLLTGSILCMFWLRTIHDMVFVKSELLQNQKAFSVPSKLVPKALSDIQQHLKPYLSEKHQIGQSFTFGQSGYPQVFERDAMRDVDLSGLSLDMGGKRTTHSILKNTRTFSKNAVNSPFGFTRYSPNVNYDTTAPKETNYRSFTSLSDSDQPIFKGQRLFPKEELTGLEQLLAAKVTLKEPKKTWLWS